MKKESVKKKQSEFMGAWREIKNESNIISNDTERNNWLLNRLAELIDKHAADKGDIIELIGKLKILVSPEVPKPI